MTATSNTGLDPTPTADRADGGGPVLDASDRSFWIGLVVVVLSLVAALATYLILTGLTPIVPRNELVWPVLAINVALIAAMIFVIARQFVGLWRAWRDKVAGARLHVRIVALFSIIATLPALLLAIGATTTFSRSLDGWFSTSTRNIIENSLHVAQAYVDEHGQVIRTDAVNMARDIDQAAGSPSGAGVELHQLLIAQAGLRSLPFAYIVDRTGQPLASALDDPKMPYRSPPGEALQQADSGHVPFLTSVSTNRVAAVAKLERFPGQYLYVARSVSPGVLAHLQRTEESVDEYNRLRRSRGPLKLVHGIMYLMISMTALLAAIWSGMWFAGRFVAPIRRRIAAAQQVSRGNLGVELPERRGEGDLRRLSHTFNTMTREIKHQRDALVTANEQLIERRRFIEAVLAGVSAGVIGLDRDGRITLASRSASALLARSEAELVGRRLAEAVPAFGALLAESDGTAGIKRNRTQEVSLIVGEDERTFAVRLTQEAGSGVGQVSTFDDVTDLVSAQRTAAWADVARRIAHEIKNPLTPIQLSTDRLRSKYGRQIVEDRDKFDGLIDTISRRVGDIKTMVDEFAAFARVPKPVIETDDLSAAVLEPVILFRESHPQIEFKLTMPDRHVVGAFDRRLISQAVTNLVKNAAEAVESVPADARGPAWRGRVETSLKVADGRYEIEVIDNGIGLPKQNRTRLIEPYVTTKGHKGTGLGLAIVQKIVEQHGGTLALEDAPPQPDRDRGALVRIVLPARPAPDTRGGGEARPDDGAREDGHRDAVDRNEGEARTAGTARGLRGIAAAGGGGT